MWLRSFSHRGATCRRHRPYPRVRDDERIVPLTLGVTGRHPSSASLPDVTEADIRANMETNFFGPVFLARAFAPILATKKGYVDSDMDAHADGPKMLPTQRVTTVYDAVEAGEYEVLADELTKGVKAALSGPVEALFPDLHSTDV